MAQLLEVVAAAGDGFALLGAFDVVVLGAGAGVGVAVGLQVRVAVAIYT